MSKGPNFDRLARGILTELGRDMEAIADVVAAEAHVLIMMGSSSGDNGGKHQHVPSKPGDPPNNLSSHLARNIEVARVAPLHTQVVSHAAYSRSLEFGTSRMQARPFMEPARRATRDEVRDLTAKAVNRAIRKYTRS